MLEPKKDIIICFKRLLNNKKTLPRVRVFFKAGGTGLEPATSCVTGRCSNQIELPPQVYLNL